MKNKKYNCLVTAVYWAAALSVAFSHVRAQTPTPTPVSKTVTTTVGTTYCIDQDFLPVLETKVAQIRTSLREEKAKGKFIGYISIPISPAGGGLTKINKEVSADLKKHLECEYGNKVWMLDPAGEQEIPDVNGKPARGQEYMYMWTQVLAGEDGRGRDFDFFYFAGPEDFWRSLRLTTENCVPVLEALADKEKLTGDAKRLFVSYYTFRASASASKGSHDEWNILRLINNTRRSDKALGVGNQIAGYFDGKPIELDDVESSVSAGYEGACELPK